MENIIYTVNLDFTDNGCVDTGWRLKQGDYGNSKIVVKLSNNGDIFYDGNLSPQITFKRADGNSVVSWMTADANYQGYTYIIVGNELEIPGSVIMDLKVIDSEGRTSTASCKFFCVQNPEGYDPEGAHTYVNSDLVETIRGYVGAAYDAMNEAAFSAIDAKNDELDSEAWAVGTRDGDPVPSTDPAYHNNSKWWSEQSGSSRLVSLQDVQIDNVQDGAALVYDATSQKWVNGAGSSTADSKITNYEDRGYLGKNKFINSLPIGYTKTINGITFTVNDDHSITANGTATAQANAYIYGVEDISDSNLKPYQNGIKQTDILSGCPSNGSENTYLLIAGSLSARYGTDTGNGAELTNFSSDGIRIIIRIARGVTVNNLVFKPMIRDASSSATFVPYAKSNIELDSAKIDKTASEIQTSDGQFTTVTGGLMQSCIVNLEPIQSGSGTPSPSNVRAISGHTSVEVGNVGKNILDYTYPTTTSSGITCTNNGDGTYTLNGTATANATFILKDKASFSAIYEPHKSNEMKLLGCPSGGSDSTYRLQISRNNGSLVDTGNGVTIPSNALASSTFWNILIVVYSGQTLNNLVFKPMLTKDLSATYSTFVPYNGYTTTINLGGTYYGGTLDAVSGVLTVTHALVDLGSYTWNKTNANLFFTEYPRDFKKAVYASGYWYANGVCECYKFIQNTITSEDGVINLYFEESRSFYRMFVNDSSRYSLSASDFKTAVTGQYLVYELATPFTIQLTPKNLETLVGQNNVFAPLVGQTVESVEYREVFAWDDAIKIPTFYQQDVIVDNSFDVIKTDNAVSISFKSFYSFELQQTGWVTIGRLPPNFLPDIHSNFILPDLAKSSPESDMYGFSFLLIDVNTGEVKIYNKVAGESHAIAGSYTYLAD